MRGANFAVGKWFAWLDGDLPQVQLAQGLHRGFDVVFFTDRHAATGQHQVVRCRRLRQRFDGGRALVGHDAVIGHSAAQALQQGAQKETVGVVNGTRAHRVRGHFAGHHQLVTGRKQSDARLTSDGQAVHTDAGGQPQGGGGQALPMGQHHLATVHVLSLPANPLPWLDGGVDAHMSLWQGQQLTLFLRYHSIGTERNRRAGENPRYGAWHQAKTNRARRDALRDFELTAGLHHVGGAHRKAVHRAVVARRHFKCGQHVLAQHTAIGVKSEDLLHRLQRRHAGQQFGQSGVQRPQRRSGSAPLGHGIGTGQVTGSAHVYTSDW